MNRPRFARHAARVRRLVVGIACVPIALWAQLPPSQPMQPMPTYPMPTQPAPTPDATQLVMLSPQVPLQPTRPEEILEQQLLGLTKPLECGPAPEDWAERLALPQGTRPEDVAIRQIGSGAAVVSWRGAPWATRHEVRWVDDPSGPSGPSLYCLMQWGYPIEGLEETQTGDAVTRVAEGVVVTGEVKSLSLEAAPAPAPAPPPSLVAMQDTVYGSCYGRTYRYAVMAFYADSAPAQNPTIVGFTTAAGPQPPSLPGLAAEGITLGAMLRWRALPRVYAYRIYRNGERVGEVLGKQDVATNRWLWPDTTYTDQVLAAGRNTYRVEALLSPC